MGPDLDKMIQIAMSPEYKLWQHYNRLCELHHQFTNSASKKHRLELLNDLRNVAIDFQHAITNLIAPAIIPARLIDNVQDKTKATLTSQYLNMTQLFQGFFHDQSPKIKTMRLTALYYLLSDLAELALLTSAEPELLLEPITGD